MSVLFSLRFYYRTASVLRDRGSIRSKVKQEYKPPALNWSGTKTTLHSQPLTYDGKILLPQPRTPRQSTRPIGLHLPEKHKSHNLGQYKHNLSARSLLPLISYLENYVILRCSCLEPNAS
jgi:hypothetical protein